jgi:uncharacterized protein (UPF0335 family)
MAKTAKLPPKKEAPAEAGHNSLAGDMIRSVVERIERLQEEKEGLSSDIRDIFAEAKGNGLDTKAIRRAIARRKLDQAEREERDHLDALYQNALGEAIAEIFKK